MEFKAARLRSATRMREIMTDYYVEAGMASVNGRKVAWITSGGPVEPLLAMDVIPVYPENHGAMIGAAHMGGELCEQAETLGYSPDLCSYARADIACSVYGGGPIGGLPRPDMLVCCNNICGTVLKWYEIQARAFGVPLFIFDTPCCHTGYGAEVQRYVGAQVGEYIAFIEQVCGRPFDYERAREVGRDSFAAQRLWREVLATATRRPAPLTAFDAFFYLALIVTLRGRPVVVEFYRELLAELEQRLAEKVSAVGHERYRLLWDNLPVWYRLKWLSDKFAAHDACLVADTYTSAWCDTLEYVDPDDFLGSLAQAYTRIWLNIGVDAMAAGVVDMVDRYAVDGLVMHSNRSCKPYSFGQYDIRRIVQEQRGIPTLLIEAHMVDERSFVEAQVETRIDAFMEMLEQRGPASGPGM